MPRVKVFLVGAIHNQIIGCPSTKLMKVSSSPIPGTSGIKRVRRKILTQRLSTALEKCRIGDRDLMHILTACVQALFLNSRKYVINRTSIKNEREHFRKNTTEKLPNEFVDLNLEFVVTQWDSKILPDVGNEKFDRLPIITTASNTEQFLGDLQLSCEAEAETASTVYDVSGKWSLTEKT
ncbi:hypothetical protein ILUMI_18016 [Ignelater luminosus]|uniref:Uncharacterized protein n=1 Tax=Ignelater luminosus TaxID=2038154 RepID=A0A8K0CPZ0_IGNLU|nr:hypothetical protein ILUMI_18016 [Ignelater luminosus]